MKIIINPKEVMKQKDYKYCNFNINSLSPWYYLSGHAGLPIHFWRAL